MDRWSLLKIVTDSEHYYEVWLDVNQAMGKVINNTS